MALAAAGRVVRVAVTQAEPEWLDLPAAVKKTCDLITEAAGQGAKIVTFPECWIAGYPAWIWLRPVDFETGKKYIQNSLAVESPEMQVIQACAKRNKIVVCLGFSENHHNSLYISQATIGETGELLMHRRKIMPTHMERTIFGNASGESLANVVKTSAGRVGQLACWEHVQPLLKYHTITQREEIHVSAWPPVDPYRPETGELWSMTSEGCRVQSRLFAIESQAFVLHTTQVITEKGIEAMKTHGGLLMSKPGGGSSAIFGPDGRQISEDVPADKETIIYADLELDEILKSKAFLDTVGHYSRPDLLWLGADNKAKLHLRVNLDEVATT